LIWVLFSVFLDLYRSEVKEKHQHAATADIWYDYGRLGVASQVTAYKKLERQRDVRAKEKKDAYVCMRRKEWPQEINRVKQLHVKSCA
jgi:hypothetical protein